MTAGSSHTASTAGTRARPGQARQHARLAQDVVGAGRQRAARRPAQHDVGAVAAQRIGHVGVPVADGRDARRRRRPGRGRRGSPAAGRARAAARARWLRPRRGCGRRRPGPPGCSPLETLVATVSRALPAPDADATTTFRVSRWFLGQCRSSCDVPPPSSPRCAPWWRCSSRPPRRRPRRSRSPSRPRATSRTPRPATRPSRTSPRSACTRCASCSTGTMSRRRPTRASSRSSPRPIRRATTGAPTTPSSTASRRAAGTCC